MGLFHPANLLWGLLAIAIVLFYVGPWRRRPHVTSTSMLWRRAFARRTVWSRVRRWVSLAVWLAAFGLMVVGLAQPFWTAAVRRARNIVVILDTSAGMSATDVPPSRLSQCEADARRLIDGLGRYEQMALLSAGGSTRVDCTFTGDRKTLRAALDAVRPTDAAGHMERTVALARRMLDGRPNGRIIVLTDGCLDKEEAARLAKADDVQLGIRASVGANLGITHLAVRPSRADPAVHEVFVEVANYAAAPVRCRLQFEFPDHPPRPVPLELAPGELRRVFVPIESADGGRLRVRLEYDDALVKDALATDDAATVTVPPRNTPRVALAAGAAAALEDALRAMPLVALTVVEHPPQNPSPGTITIFQGRVPPRLPQGPVIAVGPESACDLWEPVDPSAASEPAPAVESDSPLTAGVDLASVVVEDPVRLKFADRSKVKVLAVSAEGDPILSLVDRAAGRVLVLHVRLEKSDLVLRPSFPRLLANAIRFLGPKEAAEPVIAGGPAGRRETDLRPAAEVRSAAVEPAGPGTDNPIWVYCLGVALVLIVADWVLFHWGVLV